MKALRGESASQDHVKITFLSRSDAAIPQKANRSDLEAAATSLKINMPTTKPTRSLPEVTE